MKATSREMARDSSMANGPMPASPVVVPFSDPNWTAKGERRAVVPFAGLKTLWVNTGTLCNITCVGCYIESSPRNDALAYISRDEMTAILAQAAAAPVHPQEIAFTGGEPFMNPHMMGILEDVLAAGFETLVLTNAMKPMQHRKAALLDLHTRYPGKIRIRVSVDHYELEKHEQIRGDRTFAPAMEGIRWLSESGFDLAIAGRLLWNESEEELRKGYQGFFEASGIDVDAHDRTRLVLFPEMDETAKVPEISEGCWTILKSSPSNMMCATERMVVKRKGADAPVYVACTLIPHDPGFELGATLEEASRPVSLNHRHCAKFCVLGGASCSGG